MRPLIVSYQLGLNAAKKATKLSDDLEAADGWWHHIDTTWIILSNDTVEQWTRRLRRHLDDNDKLLVMEIQPRAAQGWLPQDAWAWITRELRI